MQWLLEQAWHHNTAQLHTCRTTRASTTAAMQQRTLLQPPSLPSATTQQQGSVHTGAGLVCWVARRTGCTSPGQQV